MKFKSYTSNSNLSDYTLGTAYAFYIRSDDVRRLERANPEHVRRYASAINEIANHYEYSGANGRWLHFTRAFGVVVEKHSRGTFDFLTVMFRTVDGDYVLSNYVVGFPDVFTNNKDHICPVAVIGL